MATATLLLGSNRGNRVEILEKALHRIDSEVGELRKVSSLYESEPWGFDDEIQFLNQVLIIDTPLGPKPLLKKLLQIEALLGRKRNGATSVYSGRPIDIDILFYDDLVINDPTLQLPHPRMHNRMFTMIPLAEVAPDLLHPVLKKPVSYLKMSCPDKLNVRKYRPMVMPEKAAADEL